MRFANTFAPAAVAAASALLLSACVVAPLPPAGQPVYGGQPVYETAPAGPVVIAPSAPPPMQVEVMPAAPAVGYVWIGGHWGWAGGRYVWNGGRWAPPRPGYRWVPHQWAQGPGGWHQHGGYWVR